MNGLSNSLMFSVKEIQNPSKYSPKVQITKHQNSQYQTARFSDSEIETEKFTALDSRGVFQPCQITFSRCITNLFQLLACNVAYLDPLEKATCSVVLLASEIIPNPGRPRKSHIFSLCLSDPLLGFCGDSLSLLFFSYFNHQDKSAKFFHTVENPIPQGKLTIAHMPCRWGCCA